MDKQESSIDYLVSIIRTVQSDMNDALDAYQANPRCGDYSIENIIVPALEAISFLDGIDDDEDFFEQFKSWGNEVLERYDEDDDMYGWYRETVKEALDELD